MTDKPTRTTAEKIADRTALGLAIAAVAFALIVGVIVLVR